MADKSKKHILSEVLSEAEKGQLEAFCANQMMMDAVKKVLLFPIYDSGVMKPGETPIPRLNFFLNLYTSRPSWKSEDLGEEVKVRSEALMLIENAFMEIEGYQKLEIPSEPKENIAR